jgi:2'-5' RNA ligase
LQNLHVTLAFLGSVPQERIAEVAGVAARVAGEVRGISPLQLAFDAIELWKKARVICATARATPPVIALASALQSQLGIQESGPFRPHITLVRKVAHPIGARDISTVASSFTQFVLVESLTEPQGAVYRVIGSFDMSGTSS